MKTVASRYSAFANGDRRDHDDELRPAIALVHLENGLDVSIGLARACLHLDVEMDVRGGQRILPVGSRDAPALAAGVQRGEIGQGLVTGRFWRRCTR